MSDSTGIKRLYKSRTDRMLDGVCGGGAKYFNLDPTLVRIAWVLLALLGGSGILLYIVAMIVMPKEPYIFPNSSSTEPTPSSKKNS
ncbi:MAG: PspC domain-containing protein, partial [Bacteroidota bacterium]